MVTILGPSGTPVRTAERQFADAPSRSVRRQPLNTREIGATGHVISMGLLYEQDYNTDLRTPQSYMTFDRMRKSDGQVKAAMMVIKLPLLAVDWHIEPATTDPQDVMIAEWLHDRLFNHMTITWHNFLRQALLCLDYGNMPFEKVWELVDGLVSLRKLAPRLPASITEWHVDETGGLEGIQQSTWIGGTYKYVDISVDKLLVFINELEGSDYKGQSLLRAAYKHWYFKDKLYIIDAIAKERRAVGIDVGTLKGGNVDEEDRIELENALMTLHAHEKQFFVEQEERYSYRVEGADSGSIISALESIEHHDLRILRSVLAEFLAMGAGAAGSLAMHRDKSAFFVMALEALATNIKDTFNRYLIPQWVDYNWTVEEYPTLEHSRLDSRDLGNLAEAVSKFVTAGVLTIGPNDEREVRTALGFPDFDPEAVPPEEPPVEDPTDISDLPIPIAAKRRRRATYAQHVRGVNFAAIGRAFDQGEIDITNAVKSIQKRQINKLVELAATKPLEQLSEITVPYRTELTTSIFNILEGLFDTGREQVAAELNFMLHDTPAARQFLELKAKSLVNVFADRLKSTLVYTAFEQDNDADAIRSALEALSDREIRKIAGSTVSEALNMGRDSAATSHYATRTAIFSAILDENCCAPCEAADGIEVKVGSAEYRRLRPPYKECHGRNRCRCVFVYI